MLPIRLSAADSANAIRTSNAARRNAAAQYADPNPPPYKPELLSKVQDLARNESKVDTAFFCKPGGVPRIGPPHAIVQAPGMPDLLYYGDSIGRWTIRFADTVLGRYDERNP